MALIQTCVIRCLFLSEKIFFENVWIFNIRLYFCKRNQNYMSKDYFIFSFFDELQVGDVFKFSPIIDNDIPSKFYTVYHKDENITKFNATYGKELNRMEFANDTTREVRIFPNRKR